MHSQQFKVNVGIMSHLSLIINSLEIIVGKIRYNTIKIQCMVIIKIRLFVKNLKNILKLWKHFIKVTHNTPCLIIQVSIPYTI